jgi:hypothetical protein
MAMGDPSVQPPPPAAANKATAAGTKPAPAAFGPGSQMRGGLMRFIPTRIHGYLDYGMGVLLILSPWIFGFANGGIAQWLPVILGFGTIVYSALTDYELGVAPTIAMPTHLWLDIGSGVLLAVSPWLFGFASIVFWPHLIFGLLEIGAGLTTRTVVDRPAAARDRF